MDCDVAVGGEGELGKLEGVRWVVAGFYGVGVGEAEERGLVEGEELGLVDAVEWVGVAQRQDAC